MEIELEKYNPLGDEHSFVRLTDTGGDELSIVNAARVSLHNESELIPVFDETKPSIDFIQDSREVITGTYPISHWELSDKDKGLLNFLLKKKHGSPFEHNWFSFHIRLPIFVMREHVRHRIGFSINEESGRYVEMRPDFFIPKELRTQEGKPGAYTFVKCEDYDLVDEFMWDLSEHSHRGYTYYKYYLEKGVAKEQARLFLGLNLYTECRWTCNARSLMNYLTLRNAPDAMEEIKLYAQALEEIFEQQMPNVHKSFVENGRVAP